MALSAGDIAFVQYNEDSPDNFAFVTLTDIGPGEEINFTDIGWNGSAFNNTSPSNDSVITWASGAGTIPAGTVITIAGASATGGGSIISGSGLSLAFSGDQITAFQGAVGYSHSWPGANS